MSYPIKPKCKRGHRYTPENTRIQIGRTLYRRCVKCARAAVRATRLKKAQSVNP